MIDRRTFCLHAALSPVLASLAEGAEAGFQVLVAGPEARMYHTLLHVVPPDSSIAWDITQERGVLDRDQET